MKKKLIKLTTTLRCIIAPKRKSFYFTKKYVNGCTGIGCKKFKMRMASFVSLVPPMPVPRHINRTKDPKVINTIAESMAQSWEI